MTQEVILLYNCSPVVGHYSAILRYDASVMSVVKGREVRWVCVGG